MTGANEIILHPALLGDIIAVDYRALSIVQQSAAKIQTIDGKQDIIGQQSAAQLQRAHDKNLSFAE
jgi:hypothetical protein